MAQFVQTDRFGHSGKPDDVWLAKQEKEPILEPERKRRAVATI
jgi:hypothetical protein